MIDINEAMVLWKERLANDCEYRVASGCDMNLNPTFQCRIQYCPILHKAKLEKKIIYEFEEI